MALQNFFTSKDALRRRADEEAERQKARDAAKKTSWERLLTQMAAANQMDAKTLGGIALGKLLHDAFFTWKDNYDARGAANADFLMRTPDEQTKILADLDQTNPERATRLRNYAGKNLPTNAQINSDAIRPFVENSLNAQNLQPRESWQKIAERAANLQQPPTAQEIIERNSLSQVLSDAPSVAPQFDENSIPRRTPWQKIVADSLTQPRDNFQPTAVLGESIPILRGDVPNQAWQNGNAQAPALPPTAGQYIVPTAPPMEIYGNNAQPIEYRPATAEDYARVRAASSPDLNEWKAIIEREREQERAQQNAARAEKPDTKERINAAVLQATQLPSSAFAQNLAGRNQSEADRISDQLSRQQQLNPNSIPTAIYEAIVGEKQRYDSAPQGSQGDEQRALAHDRANKFRALLNEQGYDFDGYSADDTLGEAQNQLAVQNMRNLIAQNELMSQKAQAVTDALTQGDYVRNADQYYEDEYRRAINLGIAPNHARTVAANRAQEYQANRMAYLDQQFNELGLNGYLPTPQGARLLAALAKSDPDTANFYANWYLTGRDIANNQHEMDKLKSAQNHDINVRDLLHQQGFETRADEHRIHEAQADSAFNRLVEELRIRHNYTLEQAQQAAAIYLQQLAAQNQFAKDLYAHNAGIDTQQYGARKNIDLQYTQNLLPIYTSAGLDMNGKRTGGNANNSGAKMTAEQTQTYNTINNLIDEAHKSHSDADIAKLEEVVEEHGRGFDRAYYQRYRDILLGLKGYQYKLHNDDNNAAAIWSQVSDVNVLEKMYPNENWDNYWALKGGRR